MDASYREKISTIKSVSNLDRKTMKGNQIMEIVILDGYTLNPGDLSWEEFKKYGNLTIYDRTSYDENDIDLIIERSKEADVLLINKTPITKKIIQELPKLKYIGVLATGYDVVDIEAASERGIIVTNVPAYGTDSVAQMTLALLLELTNHVCIHNKAVQNGEWTKNPDWSFWKKPLVELSGKTLGVIGYGRIGSAVGELALAFGMKVLTTNKLQGNLEDKDIESVDLDELLNRSDVITLHCPLTESTRGIINKKSISKMKDGVIIINTSRGGLIVENDLADALKSGKVESAGLDVVSVEPIKEDNPLLAQNNCIITPHIAGMTKESRIRLLDVAIENLKQFIEGNPINRIKL